jgi:hypothetical protein
VRADRQQFRGPSWWQGVDEAAERGSGGSVTIDTNVRRNRRAAFRVDEGL